MQMSRGFRVEKQPDTPALPTMQQEKKLTEQESLALISTMIQRARGSYHDTGVSLLLWGNVVFLASIVSYFQKAYDFSIGFDVWLILPIAIVPQIVISIKERKNKQFKSHTDLAINAVWLVYSFTIFGLVAYSNIIPAATTAILKQEGWQMMKHYTAAQKPDEVLTPVVPSLYSLFMLLYALPTLVTGLVKKFTPMIAGACLAYVLFIVSCFTASKYDMLLGAVVALVCWLIPGVILRKRYLAKQIAHV